MRAQKLSYQILDSHKNFGEGSIQSIIEAENGFWRSLIECSQITIKCGLKYSSEIASIKLKIHDVDMIEFKGYSASQLIFQAVKITTQKQKNNTETIHYTFLDKFYISQICILLHNNTQKRSTIYSLAFYGKIDYSKPNSYAVKQNKKSVRSLVHSGSPQRTKIKDNGKSSSQNVLDDIHRHGKYQQRNGFNYFDVEDDLGIRETHRNIQIFQLRKEELNIFKGISERWLQIQKKMQYSQSIPPQYQLSVVLNPKCFHRKFFCILNLIQSDKKNLIIKIKQLGGFIREQPCEECYVVTPKMNGPAISIAELMKNTKFVVPDYIEDCYRTKCLLGLKKYLPK